MKELNLKAVNKQEEVILAYLKENAGDLLAEKINNGVRIEKDGKQLINKKTLFGFMKYACNQAKEQAPKGAMSACIDHETVYGWAVHYFEEDSIEETLLNLDGTEYKAVKPKPITPEQTPVKTAPAKPKGPVQFSLFDLAEEETKEDEQETVEDITETETKEIEKPKGSPIYQRYMAYQEEYPDAVVALRLGDFYEIFGGKATFISRELGLTLTCRDCGLDERVPMVGFPFHASQNYFYKILDNHDLYVIENDDDKEFIKGHIPGEDGEITDDIKSEKEQMLETLFTLFEYKLEVRL